MPGSALEASRESRPVVHPLRLSAELRRAWQFARLFWLICFFRLIKVAVNLIDRREGVMEQRIACLMGRRILRVMNIEWSVEGTEHVAGLQRYGVVSNHFSYLDWVLALAAFPAPGLRFIAKREIRWMPVLGGYLRNHGVLIDRRRGRDAIRAIGEAAAAPSPFPLLLFPEGTRSRDGDMQPFHRAGLLMLAEAGLQLVPVTLMGTYQALSRRARVISRDHQLKLVIGKPVDPAEWGVDEAVLEVERRIRALWNQGRGPDPQDGDGGSAPQGSVE
jgi:1-acyl-sn-glycerol-3-phosphate acyltransferase